MREMVGVGMERTKSRERSRETTTPPTHYNADNKRQINTEREVREKSIIDGVREDKRV